MSGDRAWRGDGGLVEQRRGKCAVRGRVVPTVGRPQTGKSLPGVIDKDKGVKQQLAVQQSRSICQECFWHLDQTFRRREPLRSTARNRRHIGIIRRYRLWLSSLAVRTSPATVDPSIQSKPVI